MKVSGQTVPTPSDSLSVADFQLSDETILGVGSFHGETSLAASGSFTFSFGAAPQAGRLIGLSVRSSSSRTAGSISADAQINAVNKLSAAIDGSNPDTDRDTDLANLAANAFAQGDLLTVAVSATGGFLPSPVDLSVQLHYATFDIGSLPSLSGLRDFLTSILTTNTDIDLDQPVNFASASQSRGSSISLASNQFTLTPGLYYIEANMTMHRTDATGSYRGYQLHDVTNDIAVDGFQAGTFNGAATSSGAGSGSVGGVLRVDNTTVYEVRQITTTALTNTGPDATILIIRLDT